MKISTILSELDNNQEYREALYKHFHQNPELSLQEFKTADRLESELRRYGINEVLCIGETGIVAAASWLIKEHKWALP